MKHMDSKFLRVWAALWCAGAAFLPAAGRVGTGSAEVLRLIEEVNDRWQADNPPETRAFWDNAAYHTGNMEAYRLTGKAAYYEYSLRWCEHNRWRGADSDDKRNWKYETYGEGQDFVLFGDWQVCFQTYVDMYNLNPADYKAARAREVMTYACHLDENRFWWWADALYMAMPLMAKMYKLTGDRMFLDRMYENFSWSDSLMYDAEAGLYYRDAKYVYPKAKTARGGKSFWARGDGWVLAGLAKVLADMPEDYVRRDFFLRRFRELARGVAACQRPEGYWSRSMLCEEDAPGPETSGTAFFAYGLMWGVDHGLLDKAEYAPVIERAWDYLVRTALQADGSIGYVQPVGEKPDPARKVDARSQAPFGTGAWLLAACERVRYLDGSADGKGSPSVKVTVRNATGYNRDDVVELEAGAVFEKLGIGGGRQFVAYDADGAEVPSQLTRDGKILLQAFVRPSSSVELTIVKGSPADYRFTSWGRVYASRQDDLAWENDRGGWRAYGPAMQRSGQRVHGFDVFCKNVPCPMLETFYHGELVSYGLQDRLREAGRGDECAALHRTLTYHRDHGHGMDAYTVGPTLGVGAPALMEGGEFVYPSCYEEAEVTDMGPLRFSARMVFAPARAGRDSGVVETRVVTLDKGTHLNKCEVTYANLTGPRKVAAGIAVHKSAPRGYVTSREPAYVAYADAMDRPEATDGLMYAACLFPDGAEEVAYVPLAKEEAGATGHVVGISDYEPGGTFTYYFGAAWSKYDVPDMAVWREDVERYGRLLESPLEVTLE